MSLLEIDRVSLKMKVKAHEFMGKELAKQLKQVPKEFKTKSYYNNSLALKRNTSFETRNLNLAYGFLRGVPYKTIEGKVRDYNFPVAQNIMRAIKKNVIYFCSSREKDTLVAIMEWLNA